MMDVSEHNHALRGHLRQWLDPQTDTEHLAIDLLAPRDAEAVAAMVDRLVGRLSAARDGYSTDESAT